MIGQFCIIRSRDDGVACGVVSACTGSTVELEGSRRIHRWNKANTLHELSQHGCSEEFTRISEVMTTPHYVFGVCGVYVCTLKARANLERSRWAKE